MSKEGPKVKRMDYLPGLDHSPPMTLRLYDSEPYLWEFTATVLRVEGDWVTLNRTAFYPGGGGQEGDRGTIDGLPVTGVKGKAEVAHQLPGHRLSVGQLVTGRIDWEGRYELMRAHTAEHLLFSSLSRRTEMELVKISLTRKKKVLVVKGQLNWDLIREAVLEVNGIIARGSPVSCEYVDKAQMAEGGPRAKLDRIVDQRVRVVRIGEHDQAACAGVHLRDAREIGMLLVSKFTSARPTGDWEIEFLVGPAAVSAAVEHAVRALMLAERLGSLPQDTLTAFDNRERELVSYREALKVYGRQALASIPSQEVGGIRVLSGSFLGLDRKMLMERASELASGPRALIALMSQDERAFLVLARSGDLELDCVSLLNRLLGPHGGRGGGRPNFASGGTPGPVDGENVLRELIRIIEEGL